MMSSMHQFGGDWTEEKLHRLQKYLSAYMTIFKGNQWARRFTTYYVDAFAGTGARVQREEFPTSISLFEQSDANDVQRFYDGSARIALDVQPSFDQYVFVDMNVEHVQQLEELRNDYPSKAEQISIYSEEANSFLQRWCHEMDWDNSRAVLFLDPYGMSVDWETLEVIAQTKAVDLWILIPIGQAVNRLLTKDKLPEKTWSDKLTRFFGTDEWKAAFYRRKLQQSLFDDIDEELEKQANFEKISDFVIDRLERIFVKVAPNPLVLKNSRNVPIFMLYFAASNSRGAPTAVKIAKNILGR